MFSVERILRWDNTLDPAAADEDDDEDEGEDDDSEVLDVNSNDEDGLDEDAYGYFVLRLNCPIVAMFLTRMVDRATPQSMKAKVALFHNFILERGGALKLVRPANPDLSAWRRLQLTSTGKCWLGKSIIITGEERGQDSCLFP